MDGVNKIEFRPYMVQCAHHYFLMASKAEVNNSQTKRVMAALVIEILFKSFNSEVVKNKGKPNEVYAFKKGVLHRKYAHNLEKLAETLPCDISGYLFPSEGNKNPEDSERMKIIKRECNAFTLGRYIYETDVVGEKCDNDLINLAGEILYKIIYLYKKQGCEDGFIKGIDEDVLFEECGNKVRQMIHNGLYGQGFLDQIK